MDEGARSRLGGSTVRTGIVTILSGLLVFSALLQGSAPAGPDRGDARSVRVRVARTPEGFAQVLVRSGSRTSSIVGFDFEAGDHVWAWSEDADADGQADVIVSNVSPSGKGAGSAPGDAATTPGTTRVREPVRPSVFTIVIPDEGLPARLDVGDVPEWPSSTSVLGDRDNFGYGVGTGPPPCDYFDNREVEDLTVFDDELTHGDEVVSWTHPVDVQGTPVFVGLRTWEIFSNKEASTIDLDGHTLNFATLPFMRCGIYPEGGFRREFVLVGSDAEIAADGSVTVTFTENHDDIALDASKMHVRFHPPA